MPHISLWMDMAVMFAVVIVLVVLHSNINRRPKPARRKVPERIDIRLAEVLDEGSESPTGMPVQAEMRQESEWEHLAEGQATGQQAETLPESDHVLEREDAPREEALMVYPREAGAGSARLFQREEEDLVESEPGAESNEIRQRLQDRYAMYLREKQGP